VRPVSRQATTVAALLTLLIPLIHAELNAQELSCPSPPSGGSMEVSQPTLLNGEVVAQLVADEVPDDLRSAGIGGVAHLSVYIDVDGQVPPDKVELMKSSGNDQLDQAAVRVAGQMRYQPACRDGRPMGVFTEVPIQFSVTEEDPPAATPDFLSADGFGSLPWGATEDQIRSAWGEPARRDGSVVGGLLQIPTDVLVYEGLSLPESDDVLAYFGVLPEYGLVQGQLSVRGDEPAIESLLAEWQEILRSWGAVQIADYDPGETDESGIRRAWLYSSGGGLRAGQRYLIFRPCAEGCGVLGFATVGPGTEDLLKRTAEEGGSGS
jgi:protein TonB